MLNYKEIIAYIFVIGMAQGIFIFFVLWKKKENKFANKFLAVTMIIFSLDLLGGIIFLTGLIKSIPWFLGLSSSLPYLYGPLIYLYFVFLIHKQESFVWYDYLHIIPFILIQLYGILFYYFESPEYQLGLLNFSIPQPWHIEMIGKGIPVSGMLYLVFTVIEAIRFNRKIKNSYSNLKGIDLSWLLYLILGTAAIWIVVVLSYTLNLIYGEELQANLLIYVFLSVFLYTLAIKSYRQPQINSTPDDNGKTYKKSGLSDKKADEIHMNIINYMNYEKPYLDPKLSLAQLAEGLNISSHNLSEVINTRLNQNFYDFINSYRVEEAKKLIKIDNNSTYNILAHGLEAGFSSKSAYYSAFKKFTKITPAQYRKKI